MHQESQSTTGGASLVVHCITSLYICVRLKINKWKFQRISYIQNENINNYG